MKKVYIILLSVFSTTIVSAQEGIKEILSSNNSYNVIVSKAEQYFDAEKQKALLSGLEEASELDDDYVKFKRWQSFWKSSLTVDGKLGDISAYWKNKDSEPMLVAKMSSPYANVSWTNLSYNNYISHQIGLGRTTSIGFHPTDPNTFYVSAAIGGVWKTTNGGNTYIPLGDELPFMAVSSIIVKKNNPSILYIAVSDHVWYGPPSIGVYKSINGGASWQPTPLSFNLADNIKIYWLEADPINPDIMFVGTSNGLYRTTNGFLSISKINSISTFDVKVNKSNSSIVYQGGNNGEFLRSTDGGNTFSLIRNFGSGSVYAAVTSLNTSKVYARNSNQLYKSTDNGASFPVTGATMPVSNGVLTFSPSNENILLTGNFETQRSDNDGATFYATSQWEGLGGLPLIHVDQRNIFINPLQPDFVYYCNDGGVYRYIVSTNQFVNLCHGLQITQFYDIAVAQSDANVIGGGSQDNGNVFRGSTGTWAAYAPTGDGMNQEIDPTDANTRYWSYQNGGLNRWANGINTDIAPTYTGAWETPYRLDPTNPSRIIAGYDRVFQSLNKGNSWTALSGYIFGGYLDEIAIAKSNPNRIYAARANKLYVKSISDNTWTTRNLPGEVGDLEVDPVNMDLVYVTIMGFIGGSKVYKSLDAGASWINISGSLPNVSTQALEIYENIDGGLFVGTDAGVFYRDNSFDDWQLYGKLPHTRVTDIEIQYAAKLIRVGTHGRGVLEAPIIINTCGYGDPDADNDGVCDANDACPDFNNSLNGTPCDDGDPNTTGEKYEGCECKGGVPVGTYCVAAGTVGTGNDWIKRVTLHTLDNGSGKTTYSNFKTMATTLGAGGSYTLTVELNSVLPTDKVYAWIDFNRNGIYDPAELINMSVLNANNFSQGTINVPSNIGTTATTMRVRNINADPNTPDPCGNYPGEVEDYTIGFSHCPAAGYFGTSVDWISNVKINTINNSSVQTYYSDFSQLSTNLARGQSYPIEVKMNYAFNINDVFVWIDYNHNGVFEGTEQVLMTKPVVGSNSISSGVVNVPANALPGETVMRVRSQYGNPNTPTACGSGYAGEVEDYTINITYCAAAGAAGTGDDYINRVTLNTLNNISGKTGYSNFKNLSTPLTRGTTYPIEVQLNGAFSVDSVYVWIDYNKNGEFEVAEQTIMSKLTPNIFNSIATGIVNVPATAIQGETVMRVRVIYANPNTAIACGDYFGEVEDYTVNLSYCAANGASGTGSDWIQNVSLNNLDNPSIQTSYSNFKALSTPLYRNNSYQLAVKINYAFDLDTVYAWIDFDKNNSFTINERVMMTNLQANSNSTSFGTITIPAGVPSGETTLRVRVIYANPNPPDPCNSYFGEVEDYTVNILDNQGIGPCLPSIVLGKELISLSSGIYKAGETITSTNAILNSNVVRFAAGKSILMAPGFIAENGAVVTIEITPCVQ